DERPPPLLHRHGNRLHADDRPHELPIRPLDHPPDRRLGQRLLQRRHGGGGVGDVAEGGEAGDEDTGPEQRNLSSNCVVEWSFGSPTIATRPPRDSTSARSGTVSTV